MPIYSGDLQPAHSVSFLWALPGLPAVAAVVLALVALALERRALGRFCGGLAVAATAAAVGVAFAAALGVLLPLPAGARLLVDAPTVLVDTGLVTVAASLSLDPLAAALALAVALVGAAAQLVAAADARATARRASALSTCVAGAMLVVLGDNFVLALVGWEALVLGVFVLADGPERQRGRAEALVVSRVGQVAWLAGVVLLFWGVGHGVTTDGPRTVAADVGDGSGASIELRTLGDRAPTASLRQIPVGPTLAPRELATQLDLRDPWSRRPFEESLRAQRVGPVSVVLLVCFAFLLGAVGLGASAAVALADPSGRAEAFPAGVATVATTIAAACLALLGRVWFLFELCPPAALAAAALAALVVVSAVVSVARRRSVVASLVRRALHDLGVLPAGDFARAAAWLDRVVRPGAAALVVATLVTLAVLVVRR